jgi:hypothetical protein
MQEVVTDTIELQLDTIEATAELGAQAANLAAAGDQFKTSARSAKRAEYLKGLKVRCCTFCRSIDRPLHCVYH